MSPDHDDPHDGHDPSWLATKVPQDFVGGSEPVSRTRSMDSVPLEVLAELDRMRSASLLSAGLAHEVSNPLASLMICVSEAKDLAGQLQVPPDRINQARLRGLGDRLEDVSSAADAIATLLRDFREFMRPERHIATIPFEPRPLVERAVRIASPRLNEIARVHVSVAETPPIWGLRSSITQIALNLLINAGNALQTDLRSENLIEIALWSEAGRVLMEVRDNGPGIDASDFEQIFEPHVTSGAESNSLGLGLPICRALAVRLGGTLVASPRPEGGCCFRLSVPIAE